MKVSVLVWATLFIILMVTQSRGRNVNQNSEKVTFYFGLKKCYDLLSGSKKQSLVSWALGLMGVMGQ